MLPLLNVSDGSATEGSAVEFSVMLSKEAADEVTVQYNTSDGTATSDVNDADGPDYTPASGQMLTFVPGETVKTISIPTGDDTVEEDDETFTLTLSAPSQNAELGSDPSATGTIDDDDEPSALTVTFESSTYLVDESDDTSTTGVTENEVMVKVTLSADPEQTVTIPIEKANEGGDDERGL